MLPRFRMSGWISIARSALERETTPVGNDAPNVKRFIIVILYAVSIFWDSCLHSERRAKTPTGLCIKMNVSHCSAY
jgi:hypothetical protein